MRKFIERVTITGADDSVKPQDLLRLAKKYPFVEWGILFSKNNSNYPRFPSKQWVADLYQIALAQFFQSDFVFQLSAHLCGQYVKDISNGKWTFFDNVKYYQMFDRFQLNFHGEKHPIDEYNFLAGLNDERMKYKQIIFQLDNINNSKLEIAKKVVNAVGLFDLSHGAGVLPTDWPISNEYIGYAGGLSEINVIDNIEKISNVALQNIWIDFETNARNENDEFDLGICERFLDKCVPYIWSKNNENY